MFKDFSNLIEYNIYMEKVVVCTQLSDTFIPTRTTKKEGHFELKIEGIPILHHNCNISEIA